jgi:hypothetical protein
MDVTAMAIIGRGVEAAAREGRSAIADAAAVKCRSASKPAAGESGTMLEAAAAESWRGCAKASAAKPASVECMPAAAKSSSMKASATTAETPATAKSAAAMAAMLDLGGERVARLFSGGCHAGIAQR